MSCLDRFLGLDRDFSDFSDVSRQNRDFSIVETNFLKLSRFSRPSRLTFFWCRDRDLDRDHVETNRDPQAYIICLFFLFFIGWFCFKVLWPIQEKNSASESIRCRTSAGGAKCRNPAIWACQNKHHFDGLCGRCFTRAQVGSFEKFGKMSLNFNCLVC